jgi:hypothetical protein
MPPRSSITNDKRRSVRESEFFLESARFPYTASGNHEMPPGWNPRRPSKGGSGFGYFPIRYVRSPAVFLADSVFSPLLLPRMLTKPRIVCFCQPVASVISARVAPLARSISASTSAFWLVRDSVVLFCAPARREPLAGDFFDPVRSVRTGVAGGARSGTDARPLAKFW